MIHDLTAAVAHLDGLAYDTALQTVCERVADGDPLLLVAPGQTWVRRGDVDPDDVPVERLLVTERRIEPPRAHVVYMDGDHEGQTDTFLMDFFTSFQLAGWNPVDEPGAVIDGGIR